MIRSRLPKITIYPAPGEKQSYLLLTLGLLSLLLFGFGGINLLIGDTTTLYSTLKAGKMYDTALAEKIAALDEAKEQLDQIETKFGAINDAIPTAATQADLLEELFTDSTQAGLTLTAASFRERGREGHLSTDAFDLVLSGEQTNLTRFLEELEKGRLILIESLVYNRGSDGEKSGGIILKAKSFSYEQNSE